ncbi:MAG: hypothetical protein P4L79_06265 [Legionella sp.]|uniref:endonuclease/exonuclease/phosphatase family protein n=1 Tax=Legionella sp. TaxID=459 RepID=UPI00283D7A45|nr:hypothetical protein [Legionella sp.]
MKMVSWNCQGAFRKKSSAIAAYMPDIAVIQECECVERLYRDKEFIRPLTIKWFGELETKGMSIMSYTGLEIELDESYDPNIQYCVPLHVKGHTNLNLLAVWTQHHNIKNKSYIGQAYEAINQYKEFIKSADTIMIGDFNSNQIWDKERSKGNHTDVVNGLRNIGLVSVYHELNNEKHGSETLNTFYMYKHIDKPYHIDYCFAPTTWLDRIIKCEIGDYNKWCDISDHVPLIIEID